MPYYGLYIPAKGVSSGDSAGVNATNASNNSSSSAGSGNDEKKDNETGKY